MELPTVIKLEKLRNEGGYSSWWATLENGGEMPIIYNNSHLAIFITKQLNGKSVIDGKNIHVIKLNTPALDTPTMIKHASEYLDFTHLVD